MDFPASLEYLYGLQRFGIKLGLANMHRLIACLPEMQEPLPCVHVAGTNGKGSVSAMLAEILMHSGLRVGLYTSPHLHCFTERIRINGNAIDRGSAARLATDIRRAAEGIPLTFFEATTAMALLAFKRNQVDIAVIETGLGGRLDATNIVQPQLCLITPVSNDHSEHLGESVALIAAEKAGIIKPGVPVVIGRQSVEAMEILVTTAAKLSAPVQRAGHDFSWRGSHAELQVSGPGYSVANLSCTLLGEHQLDNFSQAVAAAMQLRTQGLPVSDKALHLAGRTVSWPGRLEWWGQGRLLLLDVSHNRAGTSCLAAYLQAQSLSQVRLVVGLSGERIAEDALQPLSKVAKQVYAVPVPDAVSVSTAQIGAWAEGCGLPVEIFASASEGFAAAMVGASSAEPVVVCGSLFLVAALRQKLLEDGAPVAF